MATATPEAHTVTAKAVTDEIGRRRNNKTREVKVHTKTWKLGGLSGTEFKALLAGDTIVHEFKSGRVISLSTT